MQAVSLMVYEEAAAFDSELEDVHRFHVELFNDLIGAVPPESEWLPELEEDESEARPDAEIIDMIAHMQMVNELL